MDLPLPEAIGRVRRHLIAINTDLGCRAAFVQLGVAEVLERTQMASLFRSFVGPLGEPRRSKPIALATVARALVLVAGLAGALSASAQPCACSQIQAMAASRQFSVTDQANNRFNLAILPTGAFQCWGAGCPTVPFAPLSSRVVAVAAGYTHALTLHADRSVRQYLSGPSSMPPVPADGASDIVAIAAGVYHSMALRQDGRVVVWGTSTNPNLAVPPEALSNVVSIAAGNGFSLAVTSSGRVVQWAGNLGPVPASAESGVIAVSGGFGHALALKSSGEVIQWGFLDEPVPPNAKANVVAIAAGTLHSLALRNDGAVVAWGKTLSAACAQIGSRNCGEEPASGYPFTVAASPTVTFGPTRPCSTALPPPASGVRSIAAGGYRSLALLNDGNVVGWGDPMPYAVGTSLSLEEPPIPSDLVGLYCVAGLRSVRVLGPTPKRVRVKDMVIIDIEIERTRTSAVPVSISLPDAAANNVVGQVVYVDGPAIATRAARAKIAISVPLVSVKPVVPDFGLKTLRLRATSGDITVETALAIDVLPPLRLKSLP